MTPNNHDDVSTDLGRALHDRADGLVGSPITLSDVKGRASRIRRRRAVAASAAVAAGIAIIVPTALAGSDLFQGSSEPDPAPAPTETVTNDETWPQQLDTADLELGEAPKVNWIEGSTLHTPEGDVTLRGDYFDVVPYDDGWLALGSDSDGYVATLLDADGTVIGEPVETSDRVAASADGTQVLWVDGRTLTVHDNSTGDDTVIGDGHGRTRPVAVVDGVAYYNVAVKGDWQLDGRWWDGTEHDPQPGAPQPYGDATEDGRTLELTSVTDDGSCSAVRGPTGSTLGETCDFTLDRFSPDGEHILAIPAYRDGFGDGELAVVTTDDGEYDDNDVLVHYHRLGESDPFFLGAVWEDDAHVLAVTFTFNPGSPQGTWQILRIGLDGSVENAVAPVRDVDLPEVAPFQLP